MDFLNNYLIYITLVSATFVVLALFWLISLEVRLKRLFRGSDGKDLAGVLAGVKNDLEGLQGRVGKIDEYLKRAEPRLKMSLKHVGVVRFNSFKDVGGNQSFALALLDEGKNGVVISSLYGREANRTYAKPIEAGTSGYQLSEEEGEAIQKALSTDYV